MSVVYLEILVLFLLILANGILAMSEIAVVSAKKFRLQQRARAGSAGAATALELLENPGRFLSTVQIGITLAGILAGAYGGATLAEELEKGFQSLEVGWLTENSAALSVGVVVVLTTFFSLVLGELAPKQIALSNPERIAMAVSPAMKRISKAAAPLVILLSGTAGQLMRLFKVHPSPETLITEEEIKLLIEQGAAGGEIAPVEEQLIENVLWLADRRVTSVMTPRLEIAWLDLECSPEENISIMAQRKFSVYPVARGDLDALEGYVQTKDLLVDCLADQPFDLGAVLHPATFVTENSSALQLLQELQIQHTPVAFVIDEFGGIQGVATRTDLLEAIAGGFPDLGSQEVLEIFQREDGSWLFDGRLPIIQFKSLLEIDEIPGEQANLFQTLGGFVLARMGKIPSTGEVFEWENLRFEIVDMDRLRVDKVLVTPVPTARNQPPD